MRTGCDELFRIFFHGFFDAFDSFRRDRAQKRADVSAARPAHGHQGGLLERRHPGPGVLRIYSGSENFGSRLWILDWTAST